MQIGISTANLYPMSIEDALSALDGMGAQTAEVFVNTVSELTPAFTADLRARATSMGVTIRSLHSYTSCFEPYMLFSQYERRFLDGLEIFKPIYEAAAAVGADYVILHGDRDGGVLSASESIARYERLYDLGRTFGVTLLQENVVKFRACSPAFVREMRRQLGDKAQFTLDFKQCRRSGVAVEDMIDAMGDGIRHVHISDADDTRDCLMPGAGKADLVSPLRLLKERGYDGAVIIELYRHNFDKLGELSDGIDNLCKIMTEL